jgi:thiol:disulfide interchange protein
VYPARTLSQQKEEEQQQKRSACKFLKNVTYKKRESCVCVAREKSSRFFRSRGKRLGREQKEEKKSSWKESKKEAKKNKKSNKKKSEKRKERDAKNFFSKTQILFFFLHFSL